MYSGQTAPTLISLYCMPFRHHSATLVDFRMIMECSIFNKFYGPTFQNDFRAECMFRGNTHIKDSSESIFNYQRRLNDSSLKSIGWIEKSRQIL